MISQQFNEDNKKEENRMNNAEANGAGEIANGEATFQLHAALLRAFVAYGKQMRSQRIKAGLRTTRAMKNRASGG